MARQIQITLVSNKGYRAISTIIDVPSVADYTANKNQYQMQAVVKMCAKRGWSKKDLEQYGYTGIKCRVYDKEKIEREKAERYEQIKKERGWA